jgi:CBS domain-containing protein
MTVKAILSRKGNTVITMSPTVLLCDARTFARNVRVGGTCRVCDKAVGEVMTRVVRTCTQSDAVHEIMDRMTTGRFRHLPVVESGRLVGIVSIGDAVNHRLREMEFESRAMHEYILTA